LADKRKIPTNNIYDMDDNSMEDMVGNMDVDMELGMDMGMDKDDKNLVIIMPQ
jgi:hypothetical protein